MIEKKKVEGNDIQWIIDDQFLTFYFEYEWPILSWFLLECVYFVNESFEDRQMLFWKTKDIRKTVQRNSHWIYQAFRYLINVTRPIVAKIALPKAAYVHQLWFVLPI